MMKRLFTTLFIALVSIATTWATDYDLWICGTRVTSDNAISALNIPGVKGTAYYIPSSNTLNLSSAMILPTSSSVLPLYAKSGVSGLKIDVSGVCTIRSGGNIAMIIEGLDTLHIKGSGTLIVEAETYDIFFTSDYLSIEDGVSVYLIGGGLYNDGNYDETLEVNNANLFVRRSDPTWNPISMRDLVLTNAYLDSPAWGSYEWNGAELTNGDQWWYGDINIKAGTPPSRSGSSSYDIDGSGNVSLGDVTALVNKILGITHEAVDLGLPSGTLWATTNLGADNPEDYGLYFAWGETTGHTSDDGYDFSLTNYKWYNPLTQKFTKYCTDAEYGTVDNITELEPTDDAAYVNWGSNWRMPTKEQIEELINPDYTKVTCMTMNGVAGMKIMSKSNGSTIFLPFAGTRSGTNFGDYNNTGAYMTKSLQQFVNNIAYSLGITTSEGTYMNTQPRDDGLSVRPVRAQ